MVLRGALNNEQYENDPQVARCKTSILTAARTKREYKMIRKMQLETYLRSCHSMLAFEMIIPIATVPVRFKFVFEIRLNAEKRGAANGVI